MQIHRKIKWQDIWWLQTSGIQRSTTRTSFLTAEKTQLKVWVTSPGYLKMFICTGGGSDAGVWSWLSLRVQPWWDACTFPAVSVSWAALVALHTTMEEDSFGHQDKRKLYCICGIMSIMCNQNNSPYPLELKLFSLSRINSNHLSIHQKPIKLQFTICTMNSR